jgi:type IV pilus assembly protein PilE
MSGTDNSPAMSRLPFSLKNSPAAGGFTLIELMIIVAVIGLLAAVALPSFLDSVRKGRRAEGIAALTQVQQAQERWRANSGSYADNDKLTVAAAEGGLGLGATTSSGYYAIAISDATASGYTVTATAQSGTSQASDSKCQKLVMRMAGGNFIYGSVDAGDTDSTATGRCWVR